jgi:outer membrane protein
VSVSAAVPPSRCQTIRVVPNNRDVPQILIEPENQADPYNCYAPCNPSARFNQKSGFFMLDTHRALPAVICLIALACCCREANAQNEAEIPSPLRPAPVRLAPTEPVINDGGETLQDAWASAVTVDPNLEASRWESSAAQRGLYAARAERLPSISARGSYNVFDNPFTFKAPVPTMPPTSASVTVNQREFFVGGVRATQPLYTFGRISSAIDAAGAEVTAAVANEQRTELDVKLQVAASYIGVLQAQRLLQVADSSVKSLQSHEQVVKNQVDQGVGIRANLLAVQVALANVRQLRLQMQNLLIVSQAAYNRALQRPLDAHVQIEDLTQPTQQYELDIAIRQALDQRPEIGFLSAKVRGLRSLASSIHAGKYPQIVLDGGFSFFENKSLDNEAFNNVSVLAEWNFWDSGRKRHRTAQVDQSAEALLRKRTQVESLITLQVKKSWHDLDSAQQQVGISQKTLASADENLRVSENRYQQGTGTNTEVLDAQTLRTQAYGNYYRSLYDAVLAEMQLLRAIGAL